MQPSLIGLMIFLCLVVGALIGMFLRAILPDHHFNSESKDTIKLGTGLIGTMAALVLGLMVASAKSSYDVKKDEVTQMSANIVFLDRLLAQFGDGAAQARELLPKTINIAMDRLWAEGSSRHTTTGPTTPTSETLFAKVHELPATTDAQKLIASQAQSVLTDVAKTRMLLFQQKISSISIPFLVIVVCWLTLMFLSFGLFAPRNATVMFTLLLCALSVAGALYLILELDCPFDGFIQISKEPLINTLAVIGH